MMVNENADSYNRKTDTYIVAYFYLLGVTSRIKSDMEKQEVSMNKLHNLYTFSVGLTRDIQIKYYAVLMYTWISSKPLNMIIGNMISYYKIKGKIWHRREYIKFDLEDKNAY